MKLHGFPEPQPRLLGQRSFLPKRRASREPKVPPFLGITPFLSGVARGLLQGRPLQLPMGWGVGEELNKSWPTFEQLREQNLALAIFVLFFSYQNRVQNPAG